MIPRVYVLAAALVAPLPALAADAEGNFAVDGVGRANCSDFTESVAAENAEAVNAFGSWTSGFLSATNALTDETFDVTPWQTEGFVLGQMRNFCQQNPEVPFVNGVGLLIQALAPTRLSDSSPQATVTNGDQSITLYESVVDQIRTALDEAGFPVGDGDDALSEALIAFQTDRNLDQSGVPDQATLATLLLG